MYVYTHNCKLSCCLCTCDLVFEVLHIGLQLWQKYNRECSVMQRNTVAVLYTVVQCIVGL